MKLFLIGLLLVVVIASICYLQTVYNYTVLLDEEKRKPRPRSMAVDKEKKNQQRGVDNHDKEARNQLEKKEEVYTENKFPTIPITGYRLLGERNSGTNYITDLLEDAFPHYTKNKPQSVGFKHMFRHSEFQPSMLQELHDSSQSILWILVVRKPCDWADGMYRKPHHMCPPTKPSDCKHLIKGFHPGLQKDYTREEFFELPWYDSIEMANNDTFSYSNVFKLRTHKLHLMKQLVDVFPHRTIIAHMDGVEKAPELFVQDLVTRFNLTVATNFEAEKQSKHMHRTTCLNENEWKLAQKSIDWNMEASFGFHRLNCHVCS